MTDSDPGGKMDYEAIARSYHQNGFEIVKGLFSSQELQEIGLELVPRRVQGAV